MSVRRSQPWGDHWSGPPDVEVEGDDADLARWLLRSKRSTPSVRLVDPSRSDLARSLGLVGADHSSARRALTLDLIELSTGELGVNMVVVGTPPDRLRRTTRSFRVVLTSDGRRRELHGVTTVVVAVGQYLRGLDVSPRGHPGDGRFDVLVFAVPGRQRPELRRRLALGAHLPHPAITVFSARELQVSTSRPVRLEIDGHRRQPRERLDASIRADAYRMVI